MFSGNYCVSHQQLGESLLNSAWICNKNMKGIKHFLAQSCRKNKMFVPQIRSWKWEFSEFDKTELWCLYSDSVKRLAPPASTRQPLTSELISKALWVWETACSGICGKKKKRKTHNALSCFFSLSVSSLSPLRTDRSFDSGSKFTPQTCWEAGERSSGKTFLHFKGRERLPDSLSEILKVDNKFAFAQPWLWNECGGTGVKVGAERRHIFVKQLVGLTFIGAIVQKLKARQRLQFIAAAFLHKRLNPIHIERVAGMVIQWHQLIVSAEVKGQS